MFKDLLQQHVLGIRGHIRYGCKLLQRIREQARSHKGSALDARFSNSAEPGRSEPAREGVGTSPIRAGCLITKLQQHLIRPTTLLLDHQVDEVQLGDHRCGHDERVEIRLAHAARQLVEHARQFDPGVDE